MNGDPSTRNDPMPNSFDPSLRDRLAPRQRELVKRRQAVLGPAYKLFYRTPLEFVRGDGVRLYDADGSVYLDAYNNVPSVGHSHPLVAEAIARQAATLNTNTRYLDEPLLDYSERLLGTHHRGLTRIMYACSGSEANDLALRIARFATGGEGVVVSANAYHGVTAAVAELSPGLGSNQPLGAHVRTVEVPRHSAEVEAAAAAATFAQRVSNAFADLAEHGFAPAALLFDSLFSSDGLIPDPAGLLAPAATLAQRLGALLICDEVQSGFGRTGERMWGYQRHSLVPDLVSMGKPMGNGLPISAVAGRYDLIERFGTDVNYFSTNGANSVAVAAATAVLDALEQDELQANALNVGRVFRQELVDLNDPHLANARGVGLYLAADVITPETGDADPETALRIVNGMRDRHVLISAANRAGSALKIRPPLLFSEGNVDEFMTALRVVLAEL